MKEKLKRNFKVTYIVNCIFLAITLFWLLAFILYNSPDELEVFMFGLVCISFYFWNMFLSLISFILAMIFGIINYKKTVIFNVKKKIKIMLIITGIIHLLLVLFVVLSIILS